MTSQVSEALKRIKPSATMAMSAKARALKAAGRDCIALSQGEPDFDTPENIKEAAIRAMREGKTKYTDVDGIPELKDAICAKFKRENGLDYKRTQVNVSPGGKPVIFNAFMATLNPGDEVIIPAPYWVSYPDMALMCGGTPVFAETRIEDGFKLRPEMLAKAITPHTKWLLINSPSNPSGAAYTRAELRALADVLLDAPQVMILTDDMYEHLTYGDFEFTTIAQVEPKLYERTLTMNGVSKAYSMTGWRIGYAAGPKDLVDRMVCLQGHATSGPPGICQRAALAALTGPTDEIERMRRAFDARRRLMVDALRAIPGVDCPVPDGAFYALAGVSSFLGRRAGGRTLGDVSALAEAVLEEAKVAVISGEPFGAPDAIRLSYACSEDTIRKGMDRLAAFFRGLA